jgi:hypothetical protein
MDNKSLIIDLSQPNTTTVVSNLLVLDAKKDIPTKKDPTKCVAITKVINADKVSQELWTRNNIPLGEVGQVIDVIAETDGNRLDPTDPTSPCYSNLTSVPSGFFNN